MNIESIELRQITLPLVSPFTTSFGTQSDRPCVIVTVRAGEAAGYGECVAGDGPWYSYETVATAWHVLEEFLTPRLLGFDLDDPTAVWDLFAPIRGHNMAKAALEMACWDLAAKTRGVSLRDLLGGARDRVAVGVSVGIQASPAALVDTVRRTSQPCAPRSLIPWYRSTPTRPTRSPTRRSSNAWMGSTCC